MQQVIRSGAIVAELDLRLNEAEHLGGTHGALGVRGCRKE
jgi:hypothetical protein